MTSTKRLPSKDGEQKVFDLRINLGCEKERAIKWLKEAIDIENGHAPCWADELLEIFEGRK